MVFQRKRKLTQWRTTLTTLSIGGCAVEFPSVVDQECTAEKICLQVHQPSSIKISVNNPTIQASVAPASANPNHDSPQSFSFQIVNPKALNASIHKLCEVVTQFYKKELPAMCYTASTGKGSNFLRNCTSSGNYCTLLMKKPTVAPADTETVVGAITFQILPNSTHHAEIALAAVDKAYQHQGLGQLLVAELTRRLTDVGVLTLFCWGDRESELFWTKQAFVRIGGVNSEDQHLKLHLKHEIRNAPSLPANSFLMVRDLPHLNTAPLPGSTGENSSHPSSEKNYINHKTEEEVRNTLGRALVEARQLPTAWSDISDPCSLGSIPRKVPPSLCATPEQTTTLSSPNLNSTKVEVNNHIRGCSRRACVVTNPRVGYKSFSARFNRTLQFSGDKVATEENSRSADELVKTLGSEDTGPTSVNLATGTKGVKNLSKFSSNTDSFCYGEILESMRSASDIMAPVTSSHTPGLTHCNRLNMAPATQEHPQLTTTDFDFEMKDTEPMSNEFLGTSGRGSDDSITVGLKRGREKLIPEAKSCMKVRRRNSDSPTGLELRLQGSEPSSPKASPLSLPGSKTDRKSVRRQSRGNSAKSNEVSEACETLLLDPSRTPEQVLAALNTESARNGSDLTIKLDLGVEVGEVVDSQEPAIDGYSTSSAADDKCLKHSVREKKNSTIRKRLSSRLTHVAHFGEDMLHPLDYPKDSATCSTPIVFLANMPNDAKKRTLAQSVEKLGGKVTGDGGQCTHVIASEVRRTLNFCTALCSGTWVVTPDWLKASSRHKSFVDEKEYLLRDKDYESKYEVPLSHAIRSAQHKPCSLFAGFSIYPTMDVQPPRDTIIKLTEAAGGKILKCLDDALKQNDKSHTIILASENNKEVEHAKAGLRTLTGEWFMQAIVKQKIDLNAKVT